MTKQQLFEKYNIDESHNLWDPNIDSWASIEIYRIMHNGNLPVPGNTSVKWVTDFLDKRNDMNWWMKNVMSRRDWGSLYLTAKRMIGTQPELFLCN